jgi:hypothetical protein
MSQTTISRVTRRDIFDELRERDVEYYGRLDEIEFLSRLYDLDEMESADDRLDSAKEDIIQHRYTNDDWNDDWVYEDERFELLDGDDETILKFLCQLVHPEVRAGTEAEELVALFNRLLASDGWELYPVKRISGRPVYGARQARTLVGMPSKPAERPPESQTPHLQKPSDRATILFVSADPTDAGRLRLGQELREIQEKLRMSNLRDRFTLHQCMSTRPPDISQALLDTRPQFVHFAGHGKQTGELCFEDETGRAKPVPAPALAALFGQFRSSIACVVLNACYSDTQARAIAEHIPWVVGMKASVDDRAAVAFAVGFYQGIGAGKQIDEAFELGRIQVHLQNLPGHDTPMLVSQARRGRDDSVVSQTPQQEARGSRNETKMAEGHSDEAANRPKRTPPTPVKVEASAGRAMSRIARIRTLVEYAYDPEGLNLISREEAGLWADAHMEFFESHDFNLFKQLAEYAYSPDGLDLISREEAGQWADAHMEFFESHDFNLFKQLAEYAYSPDGLSLDSRGEAARWADGHMEFFETREFGEFKELVEYAYSATGLNLDTRRQAGDWAVKQLSSD